MSENVLRFDLKELQTARVKCQSEKCQGKVVVEVPAADLGQHFAAGRCLCCGAPFYQAHADLLGKLALALASLASANVTVEFQLPTKPPGVPPGAAS